MTQGDEPQRPPRERIAAPARVAAFRTGLSAESRASLYLVAKGYRILARRYRTPYGEIDIVAQRRRLVAFVEVKARATPAAALASIHPAQRRRIERAAQWFLSRGRLEGLDCRFDVVAISPRHLPRHLANAWTMGE